MIILAAFIALIVLLAVASEAYDWYQWKKDQAYWRVILGLEYAYLCPPAEHRQEL